MSGEASCTHTEMIFVPHVWGKLLICLECRAIHRFQDGETVYMRQLTDTEYESFRDSDYYE